MIKIKPMDKTYVHIDCLHHGSVDPEAPPRRDKLWQDAPALPPHPWSDETLTELAKKYNRISEGWSGDPCREFMLEMIDRYGTCALLAWEKGMVVGHLRFYPLSVAQLLTKAAPDTQPAPADNALRFARDPEALWVQCVMTCAPFEDCAQAIKAGARKGVGLKLALHLIDWAREHGWKRIVKQAHPDLDCFYGICGGGGKALWEKAGFKVIEKFSVPPWAGYLESIVEQQGQEKGMADRDIWTWYRMACDL